MEGVAERLPPYSSSSREVVDCPTSPTCWGYEVFKSSDQSLSCKLVKESQKVTNHIWKRLLKNTSLLFILAVSCRLPNLSYVLRLRSSRKWSCLASPPFYTSWNMASWTNHSYPPWARCICPRLHYYESLWNLRLARRFAVSRFCSVTIRSATLRIIFSTLVATRPLLCS